MLTAIILLIGMFVFNIFSRQVNTFVGRQKFYAEYYAFRRAFQHDIETADAITAGTNKDTVFMRNDTVASVYVIHDNKVERIYKEQRDSFLFPVGIKGLYYINDSVLLVKELELEFEYNQRKFTSLFNKMYAASQIINHYH